MDGHGSRRHDVGNRHSRKYIFPKYFSASLEHNSWRDSAGSGLEWWLFLSRAYNENIYWRDVRLYIFLCHECLCRLVTELLTGIFVPKLYLSGSMVFVFGVIGGVGGSVTVMSYSYWMQEAGWHGKEKNGHDAA